MIDIIISEIIFMRTADHTPLDNNFRIMKKLNILGSF
jgi:hypothetical protein